MNESTHEAVKNAGFLFRELDMIRVKGKLQPVVIYELLGKQEELEKSADYAELQKRLRGFASARALYAHRNWEEAQKAFEQILARWPQDGPSRMYWKRCQEYLFDEPPVGWDGVFTMTHK